MAARLALALAFGVGAAIADDGADEPGGGGATSEAPGNGTDAAPEEEKVETFHSGEFGGEAIDYRATAGTIVLRKDERDPHASVFYVAYTVGQPPEPQQRPVVFCFNGGPGSSSVWLHLGGLGPRRVAMGEGGTQPPPPYRLVDNPSSVLRVADLVFIDPVSTGFSRPEKGEKASDFHGFNEDLDSVAEFIRLWTARNGRWASPKYLAGESYGAFRAAGLAQVLQDRYGMYLNGIVLVSGVLDFGTLWGTDLAHICFLPSLAAVASFHGKLGDDLPRENEVLRHEVEAFAEGEYATALLRGARLPDDERGRIADRLARYTGLDADLIARLDLRIPPGRFREQLLRGEGLAVGRFDGRLTGEDGDLAGTSPGFDPSHAAVTGAYSAMVKDYLRRELEFESDLAYEVLTRKVQPWNYDTFAGTTVSVTGKLADALTENRHLQVLVICGYHDLATPHFSIRQSLDQLQVGPGLRDNIDVRFYEGGHMMYTIDESNEAVNNDISAFVAP